MQLGKPGSSHHFTASGLGTGIGQIVIKSVVEQHCILGNDADSRAQTGLSDLADILTINQDAAAVYLVETKQQARQRGLTGPAGTHYRQLAARRNSEADVEQDLPVRLIAEVYVFKAQLAALHRQFHSLGTVLNFGLLIQQFDQHVHIGQRILDLPVHDAKKAQGYEYLQEHGVDEHQIAEAHGTGQDFPGREEHDQGHAHGDDGVLPEVQGGHRGLAEHGAILPVLQGGIAAAYLQFLTPEVLDRLVIDQAVDGLVISLGFQTIHVVAVFHAPVGDRQGKSHIRRDA